MYVCIYNYIRSICVYYAITSIITPKYITPTYNTLVDVRVGVYKNILPLLTIYIVILVPFNFRL